MADVLALDFDGTLVRSFTAEPLPGAVKALAAVDSDMPIAVLTNQAGPCWRLAGIDGTRYPSPSEVAETLDAGLRACGLTPTRVSHILVATWPGETWKGDRAHGQQLAGQVANILNADLNGFGWTAYATSSPLWRKPAGGMLVGLASRLLVSRHEITYVGDLPTDRQAAADAGSRFLAAKEWWTK